MLYPYVTMILSGIIHDDIDLYSMLLYYNSLCNIVICIYKHQYDILDKTIVRIDNKNIRIITIDINELTDMLHVKQIPKYTKTDECHNCYYQLMSTKIGLDIISTEYVIKCRIDHHYSNLHKMIDMCIQNNKIVSSSICVRGTSIHRWRFHLSETLYIGKTSEIKIVNKLALDNYTIEEITYRPPECRSWRHYFIKLIPDDVSNEEYASSMADLVDIINVNEFKPFYLRLNNYHKTFTHIDDNIKSTYLYLLDGCTGI